jgi:cold shock protein
LAVHGVRGYVESRTAPDVIELARRPTAVAVIVNRKSDRGDDMAPMNGTIKRLVSDKGFGFILAGDGNEYFFHNSACTETRFDDLREGQAVTFERGQGPKGPRGENVRLA